MQGMEGKGMPGLQALLVDPTSPLLQVECFGFSLVTQAENVYYVLPLVTVIGLRSLTTEDAEVAQRTQRTQRNGFNLWAE